MRCSIVLLKNLKPQSHLLNIFRDSEQSLVLYVEAIIELLIACWCFICSPKQPCISTLPCQMHLIEYMKNISKIYKYSCFILSFLYSALCCRGILLGHLSGWVVSVGSTRGWWGVLHLPLCFFVCTVRTIIYLKGCWVDHGNYKVSSPVFCIINILSSPLFFLKSLW